MKVYIGKYLNWVGPYQLARMLRRIGVSTEKCESIGDYLDNTWLRGFTNWIYKHRKRTIIVKIDDYDCWSAYYTISLIAKPLIEKLREQKHGIPMSVFCDEYNEIMGMNAYYDEKFDGPLHKRMRELEDEADKRWDDILLAMIYSFDQIIKNESCVDSDEPDISHYDDAKEWRAIMNEYNAKVQYGLDMFGKHFQSLWD